MPKIKFYNYIIIRYGGIKNPRTQTRILTKLTDTINFTIIARLNKKSNKKFTLSRT